LILAIDTRRLSLDLQAMDGSSLFGNSAKRPQLQ
jgi:hypothetical protein